MRASWCVVLSLVGACAPAERAADPPAEVAAAALADVRRWSLSAKGFGPLLARADVTAPGIATAEGLEVGQSAARADSLYAAVAVRSPHKYEEGEYLVVRPLAPADTTHRLVIELVGGSVKRFRVGRSPQVEYVEGCS